MAPENIASDKRIVDVQYKYKGAVLTIISLSLRYHAFNWMTDPLD